MAAVAPAGDPTPGPATYGGPPPDFSTSKAPPPDFNTTVVVTQPMNVAQPGGTCLYRDAPCLIQCQFCSAEVTTSITYSVGTLPIILGLVLCLLGLYCGCCLIPCLVPSLKDVIHFCPNCKQRVGRYNRM